MCPNFNTACSFCYEIAFYTQKLVLLFQFTVERKELSLVICKVGLLFIMLSTEYAQPNEDIFKNIPFSKSLPKQNIACLPMSDFQALREVTALLMGTCRDRGIPSYAGV